MNIDLLEYILAIAKEGNLSAASKKLGISTPALSKYLRNTEDTLGMPLFSYDKRRYIPTEAGKLCIQAAEEIIQIKKETLGLISSVDHDTPGMLRIGVSPNRGITILSHIYDDFEKKYPFTELVALEGPGMTLQKLTLQKELDGAIGITHDDMRDTLKTLALYEEELVLAAPSSGHTPHKGTGLNNLKTVDISDYKDRVFVIPDSNSFIRKLIIMVFEQEGIDPITVTSSPNTTLLESMLRRGNRVAILPSYYVKEDPEITYYRLSKPIKINVSYLYSHSLPFSAPERYFLFLVTKYGKNIGSTISWSAALKEIVREFDPEAENGFQDA